MEVKIKLYTANTPTGFYVATTPEINLNINERNLGVIVANSCDFEILNNNNFYYWDLSDRRIETTAGDIIDQSTKVELYFDSILKFTGYIDTIDYDMENKLLAITAKDIWNKIDKMTADAKIYLSQQFIDILEDLLDQAGISHTTDTIYQIADYEISAWFIEEDTTISDAIIELAESVGAKFWIGANGYFYFDGGFVALDDEEVSTTVIGTINFDSGKDYQLKKPSKEYNQVRIKSEPLIQNDTLEYIYVGASEDKPIIFNSDESGYTTRTAEFDDFVYYVDSFANVQFRGIGGVTLDSTTYNNNFITGNTPKNPKTFEIGFNNVNGINSGVAFLTFKGKKLLTEPIITLVGTEGNPNKLKEYSSTVIQNQDWSDRLGSWYKQLLNEKIELTFTLYDYNLIKNVTIGSKFNAIIPEEDITNRFIITKVTYSYADNAMEITAELDMDSYVIVAGAKQNRVVGLKKVVGSDFIDIVDFGNTSSNGDTGRTLQFSDDSLSQVIFSLGREAVPVGAGAFDGLWLNANSKFLIGASTTANKRLYYDGTNLELIGGTLKLSSTVGEINFVDSGWIFYDVGQAGTSAKISQKRVFDSDKGTASFSLDNVVSSSNLYTVQTILGLSMERDSNNNVYNNLKHTNSIVYGTTADSYNTIFVDNAATLNGVSGGFDAYYTALNHVIKRNLTTAAIKQETWTFTNNHNSGLEFDYNTGSTPTLYSALLTGGGRKLQITQNGLVIPYYSSKPGSFPSDYFWIIYDVSGNAFLDIKLANGYYFRVGGTYRAGY